MSATPQQRANYRARWLASSSGPNYDNWLEDQLADIEAALRLTRLFHSRGTHSWTEQALDCHNLKLVAVVEHPDQDSK